MTSCGQVDWFELCMTTVLQSDWLLRETGWTMTDVEKGSSPTTRETPTVGTGQTTSRVWFTCPPLRTFDRCDGGLFPRAQMGWVSCSTRPMTSTEDTGRMESDMEM